MSRSSAGEAQCRKGVQERSNGMCERCGGVGTDVHHRKNRSQGGRWDTANCTLLCRPCHHWVTVNPRAASSYGWALQEHEDPELVPVLAVGMLSLTPQWIKFKRDGTQEFSWAPPAEESR